MLLSIPRAGQELSFHDKNLWLPCYRSMRLITFKKIPAERMLTEQPASKVLPMVESDFIAEQFPEHADLLQGLRTEDSEFDRICLDYQEIFTEIALLQHSNTPQQSRFLADLAETLADLRCSIETRIVEAQNMPQNCGKPGD